MCAGRRSRACVKKVYVGDHARVTIGIFDASTGVDAIVDVIDELARSRRLMAKKFRASTNNRSPFYGHNIRRTIHGTRVQMIHGRIYFSFETIRKNNKSE